MTKGVFPRIIVLTVSLLSLFLYSCDKEEFYEDGNATLVFSIDTIHFDTVFTTFGTTTKWLKVYNPYRQSVRISSIQLAGAHASNYRINIDGLAGPLANNVVIRGNDSLFIFIEATIDPTYQNAPLAVEDSILFNTNGNIQKVNLIAWGQDVNLINAETLQTQTWTAGKPYLIYNSMLVDTGQVLTIEAGARIHFHRNSRMYVAGTVRALGDSDSSVIFQGNMLEVKYKNIPGQWDGIWLMAGSENNEFKHSYIRNAINGIMVDTFTNSPKPTLYLANVKIQNMTSAGIYARGSTIYAYNCEITNCGKYAIALTLGGNYEFYHSTIANFWNYSARRNPSVVLNNYYLDIYRNVQVRPLVNAIFGNCIIYGDQPNEIGFDFYPGNFQFDFFFDHCLIKMRSSTTLNPLQFRNVILNTDPGFESVEELNFTLKSGSVAIDAGLIDYALIHPLDFYLRSRIIDIGPDLGAYEQID